MDESMRRCASAWMQRSKSEIASKMAGGGTDGSNLTDIGLPCPNIFAGEENEHSKLEWTSVREMEKAVKTLQNLIEIWVEKNQ